MPIERDNESERNERIDDLLRRLQETQKRVERMAAEGRRRAQEITADRRIKKQKDVPEGE